MTAPKEYNMPPLVPRIRAVKHALKAVVNPMPFLEGNMADFGTTYTFHSGGMDKGILSADPEIIRHVLQKNHRNYRKSKLQSHILAHYTRRGLLTAEGDFWLRQRRMIQPAFHRTKLDELIFAMQDEVREFFKSKWNVSDLRNVNEDMHELTFRIIARALFSTAMADNEIQTLSDQITRIQAFVIRRIRKPFLQWWLGLSGEMKKHDRITQDVRSTLLGLIRSRKSEPSDLYRNDLLDMLLATRYEDTGEPMSEQQLLDEVLILFVAGHETSANALTWALYLLGRNPQHIERMLGEGPLGEASLKEVMSKSYTRQVIEETMRLYPPAWMIDRVSNNPDEAEGFSWPENTFFLLFLYGMHRNPRIWDDPSAFIPDRFSEVNKKQHQPYSYLPFGAGPRLCIGNQFAMAEMILTLTEIVNNYNFTLLTENASLKPLITLRPGNPIFLEVTERF